MPLGGLVDVVRGLVLEDFVLLEVDRYASRPRSLPLAVAFCQPVLSVTIGAGRVLVCGGEKGAVQGRGEFLFRMATEAEGRDLVAGKHDGGRCAVSA